MNEKKAWTVLIYANGNNDLDENIYREFLAVIDAGLPENINVVIQIARAAANRSYDEPGIRRYKIVLNEAILLEDVENTSMANPATFFHFLLWGSSKFSSEHLMVILSGHSCGFIGLMGDCIDNHFLLMGLKNFAQMLSQFNKTSNKIIDILVFDTCYMNMVEIMYELAITSGHAVEYVILAQEENLPPEGLPLTAIINSLEADTQNSRKLDYVNGIISSVSRANTCDNAIFAVNLIKDYFEELKLITDRLSGIILDGNTKTGGGYRGFHINQKENFMFSIPYLLDQIKNRYFKVGILEKELNDLLKNIMICPEALLSDKNHNLGLKIFLPDEPEQYFLLRKYYDNLLFCCENRWLDVLAQKDL